LGSNGGLWIGEEQWGEWEGGGRQKGRKEDGEGKMKTREKSIAGGKRGEQERREEDEREEDEREERRDGKMRIIGREGRKSEDLGREEIYRSGRIIRFTMG
jgi:hypothetical protein